MASNKSTQRELIEGRAALIVIDIQASCFVELSNDDRAIPHMDDYDVRMLRVRSVIDKARANKIPVIFIQEIHRANLIDFGRELDGDETVHCLDNNPHTDLAKEQMGFQPDDYHIQKRRYSAFYGTDLEILLKGLKARYVDTGGRVNRRVCSLHFCRWASGRLFLSSHRGIVLQAPALRPTAHHLRRWNICKQVRFDPLTK